MTPSIARRICCCGISLFFAHLGGNALAGEIAGGRRDAACECVIRCRSQGAWFIADSENFQVCSLRGASEAQRVARHCEGVRRQMATTWASDAPAWIPRCQIVLHADATSYGRAVRLGGGATFASALVKRDGEGVRLRRIDLRTDVAGFLTAALPHELCHVVLADVFPDAPLWLDEGIAILADPAAKQRLHERDFRLGLKRGTAYSAAELLSLKAYPPAERWGVFYGQSASLVRSLLERGSAAELLAMARSANEIGPNLALRKTFGVSGLNEIDRMWLHVNLVAAPADLFARGNRLNWATFE
jgi:hypothetical protein